MMSSNEDDDESAKGARVSRLNELLQGNAFSDEEGMGMKKTGSITNVVQMMRANSMRRDQSAIAEPDPRFSGKAAPDPRFSSVAEEPTSPKLFGLGSLPKTQKARFSISSVTAGLQTKMIARQASALQQATVEEDESSSDSSSSDKEERMGGMVTLKVFKSEGETSSKGLSSSDNNSESDSDHVVLVGNAKGLNEDELSFSTNLDRMKYAITDYAAARQRKILKGRVMRMLHSGFERGSGFSEEDFKQLQVHLPELPKPGSANTVSTVSKPSTAASNDRRTSISAGRPPQQSADDELAIYRKYRQLVGGKPWGVMPSSF